MAAQPSDLLALERDRVTLDDAELGADLTAFAAGLILELGGGGAALRLVARELPRHDDLVFAIRAVLDRAQERRLELVLLGIDLRRGADRRHQSQQQPDRGENSQQSVCSAIGLGLGVQCVPPHPHGS